MNEEATEDREPHSLVARRREQWAEHAAFTGVLADDEFVLGGPLGGQEEQFLFNFGPENAATNAGAVEERLADDLWTCVGTRLGRARTASIASVESWDILWQSQSAWHVCLTCLPSQGRAHSLAKFVCRERLPGTR